MGEPEPVVEAVAAADAAEPFVSEFTGMTESAVVGGAAGPAPHDGPIENTVAPDSTAEEPAVQTIAALDAGPHLVAICLPADADRVGAALRGVSGVTEVLTCAPAGGARVLA